MDIPKQLRPIAHETLNLEGLLNALPHPVMVVREDFGIVYMNLAAEQFFGVSATVMKRSKLTDHVPEDQPLIALLYSVFTQLTSVTEHGLGLNSPKMGEHLVDVHASPIIEMPGSALLMLEERTITAKIDRQLTHRGAARSVSGMAAVMAHEIKNPLSGIKGAAQLLEQSVDESDHSLTTLIVAETDRITRLVDSMEQFSDSRPVERAPVNIHHILEHVKKIALSGFGKNVRFHEEYDPSLPPVFGSEDQLTQVFLNIVKNASEAIGDRLDGEIHLCTAYRPGVRVLAPGNREPVRLPLEVLIKDNGPGIPDEIKPYVFDAFVSGKSGGTGLGLALVAKIIGDHGGIIEYERENGRSVFRCLLPVYSAAD